MQDPLKQGLKLASIVLPGFAAAIRMQDPLKQGLKLDPELRVSPSYF